MDGELTQPLYILHDGRTVWRPGVNYIPDRVIDSGVIQRIESHALLAVAGHWPHHRYTLTVPSGAEPAVGTGRFPQPCRRPPVRQPAGGSTATARSYCGWPPGGPAVPA